MTVTNDYWNRSCAAFGLTSYRARSPYGFIMIGARDDEDARAQASRSSDRWTDLEIWSEAEGRYIPVKEELCERQEAG